jgi:uncharacterized protein (DUF433 family)
MTDDELIAGHIRSVPENPGDARLIETGVPVWIVIDYDLSVGGDVSSIADAYGLSQEAIDAARAYYRRHRDCIDATRQQKTAPFPPSS